MVASTASALTDLVVPFFLEMVFFLVAAALVTVFLVTFLEVVFLVTFLEVGFFAVDFLVTFLVTGFLAVVFLVVFLTTFLVLAFLVPDFFWVFFATDLDSVLAVMCSHGLFGQTKEATETDVRQPEDW